MGRPFLELSGSSQLTRSASSPVGLIKPDAMQSKSTRRSAAGLLDEALQERGASQLQNNRFNGVGKMLLVDTARSSNLSPGCTHASRGAKEASPRKENAPKQLNEIKDALEQMLEKKSLLSPSTTSPRSSASISSSPRSLSSPSLLLPSSCLRRNSPGSQRQVSFSEELPETEGDFTPYGTKYGAHPEAFFFNAQGLMVLKPDTIEREILEVEAGDYIESIMDQELKYYSRPHKSTCLKDTPGLSLGDGIIVKKRERGWVRNEIGWLPLLHLGMPAFEIMPCEAQLRKATSRVGVMARSD